MPQFRKVRRGTGSLRAREIHRRLGTERQTPLRGQAVEQLTDKAKRDLGLSGQLDRNVTYIPLSSPSPIIIKRLQLNRGVNVLGIRTAGAVTVRLPFDARPDQMVAIKDERGVASTEPITLEVT